MPTGRGAQIMLFMKIFNKWSNEKLLSRDKSWIANENVVTLTFKESKENWWKSTKSTAINYTNKNAIALIVIMLFFIGTVFSL